MATPEGKLNAEYQSVDDATGKININYTKLAIGFASILVYMLLTSLPTPAGLEPVAQKALALMVATIIIWIFEVIPIGISSALMLIVLYFLGIQTSAEAMSNFMTTTIIFIMATMVIGTAFVTTGIGQRVSLSLSSLFGTRSDRVLLSFMLPTAIVSTVLTDIATAIIFAGIAYPLLKKNNCTPGKSNFGKAVMMGIPIAAAIGGIGTPAGSGLNVMALSLMKSTANIELNFLQWSAIGIPLALVLTMIAWYVIVKLVPPEFDKVEGLDDVAEQRKNLGPLTSGEKKFIIIFGLTMAAWFTSPWTKLDSTFVAIVCASLFFVPGISLLTWDGVKGKIGWDLLLMLGTANALAMAIFHTGGAAWIANTFLSGMPAENVMLMLAIVAAFGVFSHLIIPVAGATVAVVIPVLAVLAGDLGVNPALLIVPIAMTASCVFLLPIDPIPLTTYEHKYWKMTDMMKIGFIVGPIWVVVNAAFMYGASVLGLI
jgi:sodium-dependent dicarboxylate transporter 2/3/5